MRKLSWKLLWAAVSVLAVLPSAFGQVDFGSVAVGATSTAQSVPVTSPGGGVVSQVKVLTGGASNLDFAYVSDNCASTTLSAGGNCAVTVSFTPSAPSVRAGAVVLLDGGNNVLGTSYIYGNGQGALGVFVPGTIQTVAGSALLTGLGDKGLATAAALKLPASATEDGAGNIYIADSDHNRIRMVTVPAGSLTGNIDTIAGTGTASFTGDGGPAKAATLINPYGVAVDGAGNVYIADTGNNVVRKIDGFTGIISTFAGSPTGVAGKTGDGGPATAALLSGPTGVTVDKNGNLYIADTSNNEIRLVTVATGIITTVAGTGNAGVPRDNTAATTQPLNSPYAVAIDPAGNFYIPDSGNNVIEKVSGGTIVRVAGQGPAGRTGDGGPALQARMHTPTGLVVDAVGNLYIADTQNSGIRKVTASTGILDKYAGTYNSNLGGDNGSADLSSMYGPGGLFLAPDGNMLVADTFDNRIREIRNNFATVRALTTPVRVGSTSPPTPKKIEDIGNASLDITAITPGTNAAVDAASTTCNIQTALAVAADCNIGAEFAPTVEGNPVTGLINITGNTPNSPLVIQYLGDAVATTTTTTITLSSSQNPAIVQTPVTFSAVVSGQVGVPTGNVTFTADGTPIGTVTLNAAGLATVTDAALAVGTHSIVATYNGDPANIASTSTPLSQVVQAIPTVTVLSESTTTSTPPQVVLFATVVATSGPAPTGTVQFKSGATVLGTVTVDATGAANLTPNLAVGTYSIVATYSGDTLHAPSTSATISVTVSSLPSSFSLTTSPTSVTLKTKQNTTISVNLTSISGFSDTIGLGCGSLPAMVTCHFAQPTVALATGATQKVQLTIDTNNPLSGGTTAKNASQPNGLYAASIFLPLSGVFGWFLWRQRKRTASLWAMLIFLCLTGAALVTTGCGGFTQNSAKPGTYTIQVTGVGANTKSTSFQNVTLTITQ